MRKDFKILLVDDDETILFAIKEICESQGCQTVCAGDGQAAMDLIRKETFHLVITDVRMPHMDGVTLLDEIEKLKLDLPVIVMSGYSDYNDEEIDSRNGVVLLEKPFSRAQIVEALKIYAA